jgi:hypothetical protein
MRPSIGSTVGLTLLAVVLAVATIKPIGPDDSRAGDGAMRNAGSASTWRSRAKRYLHSTTLRLVRTSAL